MDKMELPVLVFLVICGVIAYLGYSKGLKDCKV